MELFDLEAVAKVGVPIVICVVFIYIVLDVWRLYKTVGIKHLEEQTAAITAASEAVGEIKEVLILSTERQLRSEEMIQKMYEHFPYGTKGEH